MLSYKPMYILHCFWNVCYLSLFVCLMPVLILIFGL